jgi:hypothetical protein
VGAFTNRITEEKSRKILNMANSPVAGVACRHLAADIISGENYSPNLPLAAY